jgi:hypothetical protein
VSLLKEEVDSTLLKLDTCQLGSWIISSLLFVFFCISKSKLIKFKTAFIQNDISSYLKKIDQYQFVYHLLGIGVYFH